MLGRNRTSTDMIAYDLTVLSDRASRRKVDSSTPVPKLNFAVLVAGINHLMAVQGRNVINAQPLLIPSSG